MMLMKLELIEGVVVKRPSRHVKTPYVADVQVKDQVYDQVKGYEILAHSPSLGCAGLSDTDAIVLMEAVARDGNKCSHTICLSIKDTQIIGINPKIAENLVESALTKNCLSTLRNVRKYNRETTIRVNGHVDSRFDYAGFDEQGRTFIMEVKVVPLADYENMAPKERAKMDFSGRESSSKVAYFPEGYRKKVGEPVSPRALKHIRELTWIRRNTQVRTIMCYVIQRTDVDRFQPSVNDPEYRSAFYEAVEAGVEVITLVVQWTRDGAAYFVRDDLPVVGVKYQINNILTNIQMNSVELFMKFISKNTDSRIVLLRQLSVVKWLFSDLSFLPEIEKKNKTADDIKYKLLEDKWGQDIMKMRRPDLALDKQWTNRFGEYICEEIYTLLGKVVSKPTKKENKQPDWEIEDAILEAKTQTFYTSGTAGEKILGCPFKYSEIPDLYGKPLKILCMGGAEKVCRESYGNLPGPKCSAQKNKHLDFWKSQGIEYVGATDLIRQLCS